ESSSAAQELAGQSQELAAMVGRFQLNRREAATKQVARAKPAPQRQASESKPANAEKERAAAGIAVTPEDLIPLHSDPDFADF
ncbi:MAG: hypothetical protein JW958_01375, partial [Candidatus Eisenbacteria bacterium]|nr:hypothetical protein [Candidatus Eisenbacteria bacterium]